MTSLQQKLIRSGQTLSAISREVGVRLQDLSHYLRGERNKVGSGKRRKIRAWLILQGYMKERRKPEFCDCPLCHCRHIMRKDAPQQVVELAPEGKESQ